MKIKFKSLSRRALGKHRPGMIEDLPEAEALVFLNLGYAEAVKDAPAETAALPAEAEETAAAPAPAPCAPPPAASTPRKRKKSRK
jgi:hypothetical protein